MKSWLKGGLIGLVVGIIWGIVNIARAFPYETWDPENIIPHIVWSLGWAIVICFFAGIMLFISIKRVKKEKIYLIPLLIIVFHFFVTVLVSFKLSDDLLILLAPFAIGCIGGCSTFQIILAILISGLALGFISFIVISIIRNRRIKK